MKRIRPALLQARHHPVRILIAILIASVLLRLGVALFLGDVVAAPPLLADQRSYDALAKRLLTGRGFSFERAWYPFTAANAPTAHWSFLFSMYLAAVYGVLGVHPIAARLVGAVVGGILLPWMVYRLSRRLFPGNQPVAILSAACAAVYAYFVLYAVTLMTETLYMIAVLWSLERAMALAEEPALRRALVLGLALGLATLLRQSVLPWVLVLLVW
ncbi:glycosyltransferase family 39 protein, partial [Chloroflexota bacterium]